MTAQRVEGWGRRARLSQRTSERAHVARSIDRECKQYFRHAAQRRHRTIVTSARRHENGGRSRTCRLRGPDAPDPKTATAMGQWSFREQFERGCITRLAHYAIAVCGRRPDEGSSPHSHSSPQAASTRTSRVPTANDDGWHAQPGPGYPRVLQGLTANHEIEALLTRPP